MPRVAKTRIRVPLGAGLFDAGQVPYDEGQEIGGHSWGLGELDGLQVIACDQTRLMTGVLETAVRWDGTVMET